MKTNKIIATVIIALITSTMIAFPIPNAQAEPQNRIILPFHTSWEDSIHDAKGRTNAVDWKTSDFYGYYGPDNPLQPELGWRDNEVGPPEVFGFEFGSRQLMAAGYFGSSNSHCYFSLFDTTPDSDCGPPIKLRPQTFISLWYYHYSLADCMIDAELFNKQTRQHWTLRDFNYDGKYIVDQNDVRIHPACRYNDLIGSWEFASFDLSIVYESDPENWYITKIWIGFDNNPSLGDGATGQARTYFDMLFISYAISDSKTKPIGVQYANFTGGIIPYDWCGPDAYGKYHLWLKEVASAYLSYSYCLSPYQLSVSVDNQVATVMPDPQPTGINITDLDSVEAKVTDWLTECVRALVNKGCGGLLTAIELAAKFCQIFTPPAEEPTYEWPEAVTWGNGHSVQQTYGEVCIELTSLCEDNSISITLNNEFRYYDEEMPGWWHWFDMTLPFNFEWSTEPDELQTSLSISASSGGTTNPAPGTYSYSYGSSVTVTASAYSGYVFNYWTLDGSTYYQNPITVTTDSDHTLKAYFSVCAMKTRTDGYFYIPSVATDLLKIEMLFDNQNLTADQTGGTSPYATITNYPDGKIDIKDLVFIVNNFGLYEGCQGWNYMADVVPDGVINIKELVIVNKNFGKSGTYITDLAGVTVTFNTGQTISPDSYGCVVIPSGATSFTVKRYGTPIGVMVIFW